MRQLTNKQWFGILKKNCKRKCTKCYQYSCRALEDYRYEERLKIRGNFEKIKKNQSKVILPQ